MRALAIALLLLSTTLASADATVVATARIGVAHDKLLDPYRDTPLEGTALTLGAEIGVALASLHIVPAIALDVRQLNSSGGDVFDGPYTDRIRVATASARLHLALTDLVDVSGGFGPALVLEHQIGGHALTYDSHSWGWHYELGVGVRLWHDEHQAIRIDASVSSTIFAEADVSVTVSQLGVSAGYSISF